MSANSQILLIVGSGPGIGLSTAILFAARKFDKVALVSRDSVRIAEDRRKVLESTKAAGRDVEVQTWNVDITDTTAYQKILQGVNEFGNISYVIFNAARVGMSKLLEFKEEEIVKDFFTNNIALYTTASWAIPLLLLLPKNEAPSFLVTSSLLWADPIPELFSLSMVKAAQRNLMMSLQKTYPSVHLALLNVGGPVSEGDKNLNPGAIAEKFWELYSQDEEKWTQDLTVFPAST